MHTVSLDIKIKYAKIGKRVRRLVISLLHLFVVEVYRRAISFGRNSLT